MKKILLSFGTPKNVTQSGQDGITYEFPFSMLDSRWLGLAEEHRATTRHRLRVGVAARINWGGDEKFLVKVLFRAGVQEVWDTLQALGYLPEQVTAFIPHGDCPYNRETLRDPDGYVFEIEISADVWCGEKLVS